MLRFWGFVAVAVFLLSLWGLDLYFKFYPPAYRGGGVVEDDPSSGAWSER